MKNTNKLLPTVNVTEISDYYNWMSYTKILRTINILITFL